LGNSTRTEFWFLSGTSVSNIPVYLRDTVQGFFGGSVIPGKSPLTKVPIGTVRDWTVVGGDLRFTTNYNAGFDPSKGGGFQRDTTGLLSYMATLFCEAINRSPISASVKAIKSSSSPGSFILQAIDPRVENVNVVSSANNITFPETSAGFNIKAQIQPGAMAISRQNFPEEIPGAINGPNGPIFQPDLSLQNETISGFAESYNNLYVFTQEKVYQLDLLPTGDVPTMASLNPINTAAGCVATGSIQAVDSDIFYLSNNGFTRVSGNSVTPIDGDINTEVKKALAAIYNLSNKQGRNGIKSFINIARQIYGCYFPQPGTRGVTFIFNYVQNKWSKWDLPFDGAHVDAAGRLITLRSDFNLNGSPTTSSAIESATYSTNKLWQYVTTDVFTGNDPQNPLDQTDMVALLTGSTFTATSGQLVITRTADADAPFNNFINIAYRAKGQQLYYYNANNNLFYPVTVTNVASGSITLTYLPSTLSFSGITSATLDRLVLGVRTVMQFHPHTDGNASELKNYTEWNTHLESDVSRQSWEFKVDSTASWIPGKTFTVANANRTLFRDFVPVMASSGRWLERRVTHNYPAENFRFTGQAISFRTVRNSNSSVGGQN
jgi:hypothetical protein